MSPAHLESTRSDAGPKINLVHVVCVLCGQDRPEPVATGYDFEYATVSNRFTYNRCLECGHWYLNPRPSSADLGTIYPASSYYAFSSKINPIVAKLRHVWEGKKVRQYAQFIGAGPRKILDVGCGNGRFLSILREHGPKDWQLVGLDFDEGAIEQCRQNGFKSYVSRIEDFSSGEGTFDAIIMLQLIEHVEDPYILSKRVFTLLKPGGCFIVETPNLGGLDFKFFKKSWWGHFHFPRHWHLFSTEVLHRMLKKAGFGIDATAYLISTSSWTISFHNFFKAHGYPAWFANFFNFQNPILLPFFVLFDSLRAKLGFQTSNQRVIARKPAA